VWADRVEEMVARISEVLPSEGTETETP
jgi:hypothetical protein